DGTKMFITQGTVGHVYVVLASTAPGLGRRGISAFVVERGTPGIGNGRKIEKLGLRSSDTAEVVLEHVRVPGTHLIGEENQGFKQALRMLDGGRIGIAAWCLGIGRGALEDALAYAQERTAFGRPLAELQAIQFMLADMATRLDAARVLLYRAAYLKDAGAPCQASSLDGTSGSRRNQIRGEVVVERGDGSVVCGRGSEADVAVGADQDHPTLRDAGTDRIDVGIARDLDELGRSPADRPE